MVRYNGTDIYYQYQLWRLRDESVCADKKADLLDYSRCTQLAKTMFAEICQAMQVTPNNSHRYRRLKDMHCAAAASFNPVMAAIGSAGGSDEKEKARQECNRLILQTAESSDPALESRRKEACQQYEALRAK